MALSEPNVGRLSKIDERRAPWALISFASASRWRGPFFAKARASTKATLGRRFEGK
jgi:hypothetical protein